MNLDLIIEPDTLEPLLGHEGLLIVDLSQAQTYARLHVPGAIHVNPSELVSGTPPATGKLPMKAALEALFSRIGYSTDRHIVVYDDEGGGWAGRFIWTLDIIGHRDYSYLNGGLHSWYREGHPVSSENTSPTPTAVTLTLDESPRAQANDILERLDSPNICIWDARSAEEYDGSKITAGKAGHIPGAVNLDWLELMDRSRNLRLKSDQELRKMLSDRGITLNKQIITHCQSHHRSGLSYLVAKHLGFQVQGYDGSWSEWGNLPDTPVEV